MSASNAVNRPWVLMVFAATAGVAVFFITQASYWLVEANTPSKHVSIGMVSLAMDIFSYYSFIWQAADGHWIFNNAMTSEPCDRVFFNPQWLAVGKSMAWFGWSPSFAFAVWRFAGAVALMVGFAVLAMQVLPRASQRVTALFMCAFGGGLGWFVAALGAVGLVDVGSKQGLRNPAIDLITPIHPFGQILANPHYSLPHGTFLLFVAAFIQGERTRKTRWYVAAAAMAVLQGLVRPYDVMTICALVPAYIGAEAVFCRSVAGSVALKRAMPFFASLPLLAYFYYIFSVHSVFKWWAIQGKQLPTPVTWHTLGLGLAGLLFVYRLVQYKKLPLTDPAVRFLVVLAATMLVLYHGNHLSDALSFSPQIGIPAMGPLILVGLGALPLIWERWFRNRPRMWAAALCAFIAINSLSSPLFALWSARTGQEARRNYARQTDMEAMQWIKENARESDVILSGDLIGSQISFTTGARVAIGHWALTPHVKSLRKQFRRFAAGDLSNRKAKQFVAEVAPRYIYVPFVARSRRPNYFRRNLQLVYSNEDVAIYELRPLSARAG